MKLFGWKGAAQPRPLLARAFMLGTAQSGEWPAYYEGQVRAAMLDNPVAQRAARLVSEAIGGAALLAQADDPAQAARALRLVQANSGGQGLMEALALHLQLHGNAYVQLLTDGTGVPGELFALRPDRVSVELDRRGWPAGYRYRVGGQTMLLPSAEVGGEGVVHIRAIHPVDDHYGLGCLGAASGAVAIHNAASRRLAVELGAAEAGRVALD